MLKNTVLLKIIFSDNVDKFVYVINNMLVNGYIMVCDILDFDNVPEKLKMYIHDDKLHHEYIHIKKISKLCDSDKI